MIRIEELEAIYERYFETVYCVAVGYGMQRTDCEDIAQETFVRLMRAQPEFKNSRHEKAWLIVTAGNLCKNFFRKRDLQDLPLEDWAAPVYPEEYEVKHDILRYMRSLPERLRLPLHLYYYEGYDSREIAEILKLHPASVRRQLSQARKTLRKKFGETWE